MLSIKTRVSKCRVSKLEYRNVEYWNSSNEMSSIEMSSIETRVSKCRVSKLEYRNVEYRKVEIRKSRINKVSDATYISDVVFDGGRHFITLEIADKWRSLRKLKRFGTGWYWELGRVGELDRLEAGWLPPLRPRWHSRSSLASWKIAGWVTPAWTADRRLAARSTDDWMQVSVGGARTFSHHYQGREMKPNEYQQKPIPIEMSNHFFFKSYLGLGWRGHHCPPVTDRPVPGKLCSWRPELLGANPSIQLEIGFVLHPPLHYGKTMIGHLYRKWIQKSSP